MSYNFPEYQDPNMLPQNEQDAYSPYESPEDFSEEDFNAARTGEAEHEKSASAGGTFYENLALKMQDNELVSLGSELMEDVDNQLRMKEEWESSIATAEKYLGRKIEEPQSEEGREWRSTVYDTTLSTAVYRIYSVYKRELFPPSGPCKSEIEGIATKEINEKGERRKMFANYALTVEDKGYYPDSDDMLFTIIFTGSAFRKVFMDPMTGKPKARFIKPQDFICDLNCTSLLESQSLGYRYKETKRDIMQLQELGKYVKFQLGMPADSDTTESVIDKTAREEEGIVLQTMENKTLFEIHERHVYLTKDKIMGGDPLATDENKLYPYRITIVDRKAVEIVRNWKEEDELRTRIPNFVHYKFLPGMDNLFGVGMAHLGGSNAITLTTILRQMINKLSLNTFPGGIKTTTVRSEDNLRDPSPGEWLEVETGGQPLGECFAEMPYPPPSALFFEIFKSVQEGTFTQLGVADTNIPENSNQTPVGTTMAAVEVANRMQSASLSSLHTSLRYEFELLFDLWAECLPDEPYPFAVPGFDGAIMRSDFEDHINTVPVSDPNVLTSTHRLMQAEGLSRIAAENPDLYSQREVQKRMLEAMGVENIDEILPPEPTPSSSDAVSENMMILQGEGITITPEQDDEAHNIVHNILLEQMEADPSLLQINPSAKYQLTQHIQKHSASQLVKQARAENKYAFPDVEPDGYLDIPEIQNQLSMMNAEEGIKQKEAADAQAMEDKQNQLLPQQVMLEDINQRREAEQIRAEMARMKIEFEERMAMMKMEFEKQMSEKKIESESFREQLRFEADTAKLEADKEMAREKNEHDLTLEQMKQHTPGV